MDNFKHTQMVTYLYQKNLRELIDYSLGRKKTQEDYDMKKKIFNEAISEKGLLENIVFKSNPDQADKIKEKYEDFLFNVFNDRVITFENGNVIFDSAQRLNYFISIFETRELFLSISLSQINFAKNRQGNYDSSVEELIQKEDLFYRSVFMLALHSAIRDSFMEFVKEVNEAKGEKTPQVNFISNILGQYISLVNGVMNNRVLSDNADFEEAKHRMKTAIDAITGKLGKKNLQDQENYFIMAREAIDKMIVTGEQEWIKLYNPLVKEVVEFEKNLKNN